MTTSITMHYVDMPERINPSEIPILGFNMAYKFLSNFTPARVTLDEKEYASVEHAYQAAKTIHDVLRLEFRDPNMSVREAKTKGKRLPLRKDWEYVKVRIMYNLVKQKFQIPYYMVKLLETGDRKLIELNHWGDTFWGVTEQKGGLNMLGHILMKVRSELRMEG